MTQPQAQSQASASAPAAAPQTQSGGAKPAVKWKPADLVSFAARWGVPRAAVRVALRAKGTAEYADPEEAKAVVQEFLKRDLAKYEEEQRALRRQGRK